jgi:8-oxo-dGTP pyrophosphatase MutT (NUDIX family)
MMNWDKLRQKLAEALPGAEAQLQMAPIGRRVLPPTDAEFRKSAVLIPLLQQEGKTTIVLTRRAEYPGVHSGQISFPGGKFEHGEADPIQVAKREAEEEIGLPGGRVEVLGMMSELYIPVSKMLVYPVLAKITKPNRWLADPREVNEVLEVPMEFFQNPRNLISYTIKHSENLVEVPAFDWQPIPIWGATAMMISELLEIIRLIDYEGQT